MSIFVAAENAKKAIRQLVADGLWKGPIPDIIHKPQEEIMDEKTYDVTWAANGSIRVKAISADAAMTVVNGMSLYQLLDNYNGPDATDAAVVEED